PERHEWRGRRVGWLWLWRLRRCRRPGCGRPQIQRSLYDTSHGRQSFWRTTGRRRGQRAELRFQPIGGCLRQRVGRWGRWRLGWILEHAGGEDSRCLFYGLVQPDRQGDAQLQGAGSQGRSWDRRDTRRARRTDSRKPTSLIFWAYYVACGSTTQIGGA